MKTITLRYVPIRDFRAAALAGFNAGVELLAKLGIRVLETDRAPLTAWVRAMAHENGLEWTAGRPQTEIGRAVEEQNSRELNSFIMAISGARP